MLFAQRWFAVARSSFQSFFLACIGILLVAGCSTTSSLPAAVQQIPARKKIAIISSIGSEMHVKRIGATVFGNKERTINVGEWELDRVIAERVASHASKRGYEAVVLSDPAARSRSSEVDSEDSVKVWEIGEQRKSISEFAKSQGVDMVLAISAPDYTDVIFGSNQTIKSFGIYELSSLLAEKGVEYVLAQIVIFGGSNGKQLAYQTDHARTERAENRMLPEDLSVNAEEMERVKSAIFQMYEKLIDAELADLRL